MWVELNFSSTVITNCYFFGDLVIFVIENWYEETLPRGNVDGVDKLMLVSKTI